MQRRNRFSAHVCAEAAVTIDKAGSLQKEPAYFLSEVPRESVVSGSLQSHTDNGFASVP